MVILFVPFFSDTCGINVILFNASQSRHYVVCGDPTACQEESPVALVDDSTLCAVRCCSDTELGWDGSAENSGCTVWGGSNVPNPSPPWVDCSLSCNAGKTFNEAKIICTNGNADLCTKNQLEKRCTIGTGCHYDTLLVWSSTSVSGIFFELPFCLCTCTCVINT